MRIEVKRGLLLVLCATFLSGCAFFGSPEEAALPTVSPSAAVKAEAPPSPSPAPPTPVPADTSGSFLTAEEAGYIPPEIISTDCTRDGTPFTEIYTDEVITLWFVSLSSKLTLWDYSIGGELCYNLLVENHAAEPIQLAIDYVVINGCALPSYSDMIGPYNALDPGAKMPLAITVDYGSLDVANISEIRQTDLIVKTRSTDYEAIGQSDRFRLRLNTGKDLSASLAAYHAALDHAPNADLYTGPTLVESSKFDKRGLRVEMLSFSDNKDGDLFIQMRYENDSEVPICVVCDNVVLNGIQFETNGSALRLYPGEHTFHTLTVEQDDLALVPLDPVKTVSYYGHVEPLMVSEPYASTNYHFGCITASTDAPGDGAPPEVNDTPIFQEGGIEIYTLEQDLQKANGYRAVTMWFRNTTDEVVSCTLDLFHVDNSSEDVLDSWVSYRIPRGDLLPHAIVPVSFYLSESLYDKEHTPLFSELFCDITLFDRYSTASSVSYADILVFRAVPAP